MGDGTPVAPATGRRRHLEPCGNSPRSRGESNVWREWNSEDNFSRGSSRAVERYDGAKQRGEPVVGHRGQRLSRRHNSSAVKGRYIGHITILGIDLDHRNARLRMGIYERRFWSQGFGREAARCVCGMCLTVFTSIGSASVWRPITFGRFAAMQVVDLWKRSLERESIWLDGRWWDDLIMGVLDSELKLN